MLIFAPDSVEIAPEMLEAVSGVPTMRGFMPPPTAAAFGATAALAAAPTGGAHVMDSSGAARTLVATSAKIYEFGSAAWTERGTWAGNNTFFLAFGADVFAIGTSTKPTRVTSTVTAVTAPKAKAGDTAGYFMMLGSCDDGSTGLGTSFGAQTNRWWCSAYADATSAWNPSVTTQCTSGLLADSAGGITAIRSLGDRFVVYKSGAMYLATYAGPPEVFTFQRISDRIGAVAQAAVVKVDGAHYFIGTEDIWRYTGTGYPESIGSGVKEWFFGVLDRTANMNIQGRHDPYRQLIYWHYPPTGASGALTKVLVYHYPSGRFGAFDFTVTQVFGTEGGTLFATTSDGTAQKLSMSYLDGSYVIKSLTGAGTTLTLTSNWSGDEEAVSVCTRVKPRFGATAPTSGTLDADTCMSIGGSVTNITQATMSSARFDILAAARYHKQELSFSGSEFEVQAIGAKLVPRGKE
jgi:hypothetical protein